MQLSLFLALLPFVVAGPTRTKRSELAPFFMPRGGNRGHHIPDEYIAKFKNGSALSAVEDGVKQIPNQPKHKFKTVSPWFTGKLEDSALQNLRDHADDEYIDPKEHRSA